MPINTNKVKALYDYMKECGDDVGTWGHFFSKFVGNENYATRKKVFDALKDDANADIGGSYEEFMSRLQQGARSIQHAQPRQQAKAQAAPASQQRQRTQVAPAQPQQPQRGKKLMQESAVRSVYDQLKQTGDARGTYEQFRRNFVGAGVDRYHNRLNAYRQLKAAGANVPGTYEEFINQYMTTPSSPSSPSAPQKAMSMDEMKEWAADAQDGVQGMMNKGKSFVDGLRASAAHPLDVNRTILGGANMSNFGGVTKVGEHQFRTQSGNVYNNIMDASAEQNAAYLAQSDNEAYGKIAKLDKQIEALQDAADEERVKDDEKLKPKTVGDALFSMTYGYGSYNSSGQQYKAYESKINELKAQRAVLLRGTQFGADLNKSIDERLAQINQALSESYKQGGGGYKPTASDFANKDIGAVSGGNYGNAYLNAAKHYLSDAQKMLTEVKAGSMDPDNLNGFFRGAKRGLVDGALDVRTWDYGITDLGNSIHLKKAAEKWDRGENLTYDEQALLDAMATKMSVDAYFASGLGRGYKAGKVTAESIPFMIEMLINPLSATGRSMQAIVARYALKRFSKAGLSNVGRYAAKSSSMSLFKTALSKSAPSALRSVAAKQFTARAVTRVGGDALGAMGMSATTGQMRVWADALNRMTGQARWRVDNHGLVRYDGHDDPEETSLFTAYTKSFFDNAIQNHSEMVSAYIPYVGQLLKSGLGRMGGRQVAQLLGRAKAASVRAFNKLPKADMIADLTHNLTHNSYVDIANGIRKRANIGGPIEEYLEEVIGNAETAIVTGDMEFSTEQGKGVFNLSDNIDTFLGVGLMTGAFSVFGAAGYRTPHYRAVKALQRADEVGRRLYEGNEGAWDQLKQHLDECKTQADRNAVLVSAFNSGINAQQKQAVLGYVRASQFLEGVNNGTYAKMQEEAENDDERGTRRGCMNSYIDGQNMTDAQSRHEALLDFNAKRKRALSLVQDAEMYDSPELYAQLNPNASEAQKQAMSEYANARAKVDGINDAIEDRYRHVTSSIENQVGRIANTQSGNIIEVELEGRHGKYYVRSGNISVNPEGYVNHSLSNNTVVFVDEYGFPVAGNMDASTIEGKVKITNAQSLIDGVRARAEEVRNADYDGMDGKLSFSPGSSFNIMDDTGEQHKVSIVQDEQGNVVAQMDGAEGALPLTDDAKATLQSKADMWQQMNYEGLVQEQEEAKAQADAETETEAASAPTSLQQDQAVAFTDAEGNVHEGRVDGETADGGWEIEFDDVAPEGKGNVDEYTADELKALGITPIVEEEAAPAAQTDGEAASAEEGSSPNSQTSETRSADEGAAPSAPAVEGEAANAEQTQQRAIDRIPTDGQGQHIYEKAKVEDTAAALIEQMGGDVDEATENARMMLRQMQAKEKKAAQRLEDISNGKVEATMDEIIQAKQEAKAIAQNVKYWEDVVKFLEDVKRGQEVVAEAEEAAPAEVAPSVEASEEAAPKAEENTEASENAAPDTKGEEEKSADSKAVENETGEKEDDKKTHVDEEAARKKRLQSVPKSVFPESYSLYGETNGTLYDYKDGLATYVDADGKPVIYIAATPTGSAYVGVFQTASGRWTSKFENNTGDKAVFKHLVTQAMGMLPEGAEFYEHTNVSADGLRVFSQNLKHGFVDSGETYECKLNAADKANVLGRTFDAEDDRFESIHVRPSEQEHIREVLKPYMEALGRSVEDIRFESDGRVVLTLPVLIKAKDKEVTESSAPAQTKEEESDASSDSHTNEKHSERAEDAAEEAKADAEQKDSSDAKEPVDPDANLRADIRAARDLAKMMFPDANAELLDKVARDLNQQPLTRKQREQMERIAKAFGLRIRWFKTMPQNGTYSSVKGEICIATDSWHNLAETFGHEMTHALKDVDMEAYNRLKQAVIEASARNEEERKGLQRYVDMKYSGYDAKDRMEEFVSDTIGATINSQDMAHAILFRLDHKVLGRMRDIVKRMRAAVSDFSFNTGNKVRNMLHMEERVRDERVPSALEKLEGAIMDAYRMAHDTEVKRRAEEKRKAEEAKKAEEARRDGSAKHSRRETAEALGVRPQTMDGLERHGLTVSGGVVMNEAAADFKDRMGYKTPNERNTEEEEVHADAAKESKRTLDVTEYRLRAIGEEEIADMLNAWKMRIAADDVAAELVDEFTPENGTPKKQTYDKKTGAPKKSSTSKKDSPIRSQNDIYRYTVDFDTACPNRFLMGTIVSEIERRTGMPMTLRQYTQLSEVLRAINLKIPCTYCYVENKRQALKEALMTYQNARQAVWNANTEDMEWEAMYGHSATKSRKLAPPAENQLRKWRERKKKDSFNPSLRAVFLGHKMARNAVLYALDEARANGGRIGGKKITQYSAPGAIAQAVMNEFNVKADDKESLTRIKGAISTIASEWKYDVASSKAHEDYDANNGRTRQFDPRVMDYYREMELYAKSSSSAKNEHTYSPYTDEARFLTKEDIDYLNAIDGLRMHSNNDFRLDYLTDYLQFFADITPRGLKMQTYTKSPDFVELFGNIGIRINMSCAMYGGENGRAIMENNAEGFFWKDAQRLREQYPNAGVMMMVTNDEQLSQAINSDWIDMIIPFHASSLPKAFYYDLRKWQDYSNTQNELLKNTDDMRRELEADGVEIPKDVKTAEALRQIHDEHFMTKMIYEWNASKKAYERVAPHFEPGDKVVDGPNGKQVIPGHHNDLQTYLNLCREYGVRPRFMGCKVDDGHGNKIDVTEHPNYMKLVREVSRLDSEQKPVDFRSMNDVNPYSPVIDELNAPIVFGDKVPADAIGRHMTNMEWGFLKLHEFAKNGGYGNELDYRQMLKSTILGKEGKPYDIAGEFIKDYVNNDRPVGWLSPVVKDYAEITQKPLLDAYGQMPYEVKESKRMELGHTFSNTKEDFDAVRERAIKENGIVMPNLNKEEVKIVPIEAHEFGHGSVGSIDAAMEWAFKNLVTTNTDDADLPTMRDGTPYTISKKAIEKYLSRSAVTKSTDLGVHLSVLQKLTDVIHESIEAEIHADHPKNDNATRTNENGYGESILIHRLYGAAEIDGQLYRIRTTMQEYRGSEMNKPHSYQVTKIELIDAPGTAVSSDSSHLDTTSTNSISAAKLLKGVEKSYDPGKKLLDESKNLPKGETKFSERTLTDEEQSIVDRAKKNGTYMLAPNGAKSNLDEKQWAQVRTRNFKEWFGDWENEPEEYSVSIDENGEPKIFYHNTPKVFSVFDSNKNGTHSDAGWLGDGFYFYGDKNEGNGYGEHKMNVFLKMENPYFATNEDIERLSDANDRNESISFRESLEEDGYDGVYYNGDLRQEAVVFNPNQIKSATENNGDFSNDNPDIRYSRRMPTSSEFALRDGLVDRLREAGLGVSLGEEEGQRVLDLANGAAREMRVYHGTHADFDRFDHSFMNSGEGAQAFGWGSYVTEVKGIGRTYAETITRDHFGNGRRSVIYTGNVDNIEKRDLIDIIDLAFDSMPSNNKSLRNAFIDYMDFISKSKDEYSQHLYEVCKKLDVGKFEIREEIPIRHLYTIEIPEDTGENYIDWDEPLTDNQIEKIRQYLTDNYRKNKVKNFDASIADTKNASNADEVNSLMRRGKNVYNTLKKLLGSDKNASIALSEMGFTGIKYPANYLRGGRKDGAKNYVIFNDKDLEITDHVRFFRGENGEAYGFTVDGKIYIDPKHVNAETPIHEYTHLWATALQQKDAKAWGDVVRLMKDTGIWDEVREAYPELETDDEIADEVLATYSGQRGAERLREEMRSAMQGEGRMLDKVDALSAMERVRNAIARFWRKVAEMLGIRYRSAEDVADHVLGDLLERVNPNVGVRTDAKAREMSFGEPYDYERYPLGRVEPNLAKKEVEVVDADADHGFKNYKEAKTWAKQNVAKTYNNEETGGKGDVRISNAAIDKFMSQSAVDKSDTKDVHMAVLKVLPDVLRTSIDVETHPDFLKGEDGKRSAENGINKDVLVHRCYGAVSIEGKPYRVKITLKENVRTKETTHTHSYEATKIELLAGQHGDVTMTSPRNSNNSISAAKLLKEVEMSYDKGKKLLDESKDLTDVATKESRRVSGRLANTGNTSRVAQDIYEQAVRGRGFEWDEAWHDSLVSVKALQDALAKERGRDISDLENVYLHMVHLSSVSAAEMTEYRNKQVENLLSAMEAIVKDKKLHLSEMDVETYLNCKHGLERNEHIARKKAKAEADEKYGDELEKLQDAFVQSQRAYQKNPNQQTKDAMDKASDDLSDKMMERSQYEDKQYDKHRKEDDYSGLTAIFDNPKHPTMTNEELEDKARDLVAEMERKIGQERVDALWDAIHDATLFSLHKSYKSGLISKEAYNEVKDMYEWYVPLRGFAEDTANDVYEYMEHTAPKTQQTMKSAEGRTSRSDGILANIMNMGSSAILHGNRNLAKQKLLNLAINSKSSLLSLNEAFYKPSNKLDANGKPYDELVPVPDYILNENDADIRRQLMEQWTEQMRNDPDVKTKFDKLNLDYKALNGVQGEHAVSVFRGGQEYKVYVNGNPRAAQAINGTNIVSHDGALSKVMNKVTRFMSQMMTSYNPSFVTSNAQRDFTSALIISEAKYGAAYTAKFANNVRTVFPFLFAQVNGGMKFEPGGMYQLYWKHKHGKLDMNKPIEKYFSEFMANGGETGYTQSMSVDDYKDFIAKELKNRKRNKVVRFGKKPFGAFMGFVEELNRGIENSCRFAAYMTSRETGRSVLQSVQDAKEVSTNFNLHGSGALGNAFFRDAYAFINPAIQSLAQYIQLTKQNPKAMLTMAASTIALGAMTTWMMASMVGPLGGGGDGDGDDEGDPASEFWNISPYTRRNYLLIPFRGKGNWIKIAMAPEIRALYGLGVMASEYLLGRTSASDCAVGMLDQLNQLMPKQFFEPTETFKKDDGTDYTIGKQFVGAMMPTSWEPIYRAWWINRDFMGKQITNQSDWNEMQPEWQRASYNTSEWLVNTSKWLNNTTGGSEYGEKGYINLNPSRWGYLTYSYLGGIGQLYDQGRGLFKGIVQDDEEFNERLRYIPVINRMFTTTNNEYNKYQESNSRFQYYEGVHNLQEYKFRNGKNFIRKGEKNRYEVFGDLWTDPDYNRSLLMDAGKWLKQIDKLKELRKATNDEKEQRDYSHQINEVRKNAVRAIMYIEENGGLDKLNDITAGYRNVKNEDQLKALNDKRCAAIQQVLGEAMKKYPNPFPFKDSESQKDDDTEKDD